MVDWLEPLELKTFFMTILSGDPDIFIALSLIIISGMAAFFRMTTTTMFFMLGLFILLFSGITTPPMVVLFSVIGGLVAGYSLSKMFGY